MMAGQAAVATFKSSGFASSVAFEGSDSRARSMMRWLRPCRKGGGSESAFVLPPARAAAEAPPPAPAAGTQQLTIEVHKLPNVGLGATLVSPRAQDPAMVEELEPGSVAARAGLRDGDHVVAVNGEVVANNEDAARKIVAAGDTFQLSITRQKSAATVRCGVVVEVAVQRTPKRAVRSTAIRVDAVEVEVEAEVEAEPTTPIWAGYGAPTTSGAP